MHELNVAQRLVDVAVETAAGHGASAVEEMTVSVGAATHLNPEQVRFCIETVAEGTPVAGATVTMETVPPHARCDCGWAGRPDGLDTAAVAFDPTCPECGGRVEFTRGRGCRLASISVPDGPSANDASHSEVG